MSRFNDKQLLIFPYSVIPVHTWSWSVIRRTGVMVGATSVMNPRIPSSTDVIQLVHTHTHTPHPLPHTRSRTQTHAHTHTHTHTHTSVYIIYYIIIIFICP